MPPALRPRTADVELAEVRVIENFAVGAQRLFENLPAVRDEEQGRTLAGLLGQPAVVQGGDDGLARAGGGHDQVAVTVMDESFDLEGVQHVLLIREGRTSRPDSVSVARSCCCRPVASASASSSRSRSRSGS